MSEYFNNIGLSYMIYGVLAGTTALITYGGFMVRRRLKPKNNWKDARTLEGLVIFTTVLRFFIK